MANVPPLASTPNELAGDGWAWVRFGRRGPAVRPSFRWVGLGPQVRSVRLTASATAFATRVGAVWSGDPTFDRQVVAQGDEGWVRAVLSESVRDTVLGLLDAGAARIVARGRVWSVIFGPGSDWDQARAHFFSLGRLVKDVSLYGQLARTATLDRDFRVRAAAADWILRSLAYYDASGQRGEYLSLSDAHAICLLLAESASTRTRQRIDAATLLAKWERLSQDDLASGRKLLQAFASGELSAVAVDAVRALGVVSDDSQVQAFLLQYLERGSLGLRKAAVEALSQCSAPSPLVVRALLQVQSATEASVLRRAAARALLRIQSRCAPAGSVSVLNVPDGGSLAETLDLGHSASVPDPNAAQPG